MDHVPPGQAHDILAVDALHEGAMMAVTVERWAILLARIDGEYRAILDRCSHAAARLSTGLLRNGAVMCARHGARFDVATGKCLGSAYAPVRSFPVHVEGGRVWVTLPNRAPDMTEVPLG